MPSCWYAGGIGMVSGGTAHLDEMEVPIAARAYLRMPDARARSCVTPDRDREAELAFGVLMLQLPFSTQMTISVSRWGWSGSPCRPSRYRHCSATARGACCAHHNGAESDAMVRIEPWQLPVKTLPATDDLNMRCHSVLLWPR